MFRHSAIVADVASGTPAGVVEQDDLLPEASDRSPLIPVVERPAKCCRQSNGGGPCRTARAQE